MIAVKSKATTSRASQTRAAASTMPTTTSVPTAKRAATRDRSLPRSSSRGAGSIPPSCASTANSRWLPAGARADTTRQHLDGRVLFDRPGRADREGVGEGKEGTQAAIVDGSDNAQVAVLLVVPEPLELDVVGGPRRGCDLRALLLAGEPSG